VKRIICDFDQTLFSETDECWMELYHLLLEYGARKVWLWSNGIKWLRKQSLSNLQMEHIDVENRFESDLQLADQAIAHAISCGYAGNPDNAALVKRCPEDALLIDDLASTWVAVGNSHPERTLTPEQFMQKVRSKELRLAVDKDGYLAAL
jgi:hypothetical protein